MRYYILASGSKGNSAVFQTNSGRLLQIDMGVTLKYEKEQLSKYSLRFEDIEALLITHEHTDHIKGASFFNRELIYCAKGTYDVPEENVLNIYESYDIAGFKVTVLATSHDATNPIGFVLEADNEKLVYMTDTGYISERNLQYMKNPDYICIESNHNVKMLFETNRPAQLIMRIIGDNGHLSNEDSAMYMSEIIGDNTKELVLMHLSEEANTHELALSTYKELLSSRYGNISGIKISAAYQRESISGGKVRV
ncbi:MAG: MBL fold metallo-hydrolase [Erysipelotrichales bacterium]|nr:MBL fold metallo-hydrolase [Erysipelotrichales bacterium]